MIKYLSIVFLLLPATLIAQPPFSYQYLEVEYDSAWTYKAMQMIPIRFKAKSAGGEGAYISLGDAMAKKKAVIKELPARTGSYKGGVTITNKTKQTILIHGGDMISGGKQDRILSKTTLIPPGQKKEILNTFCIEKERWDNKAKPFVYGGAGDIELRKAMDTRRSQGAVWREIDRQYTLRSETSKTWTYLKLYTDTAGNREYSNFFRKKMDESAGGYAGFLFVTGDSLMGVELFSKPEYTHTIFDAMVASYVNSLPEKPMPPMVPRERKQAFLDRVLASRDSQYQLIRKQGVAHRQDGKVLHMVVYGTGF